MKASTAHPASPEILGALRARARGGEVVSFADFMDVALYDPNCGYYRKAGPRIGRGPGTDFFTSSSSPLFGRLVVEACGHLLAPDSPAGFDFVEIGAEAAGGVLGDLPHPFASSRQVQIGEPLRIERPSVVFSNELFDAQPFRRFRMRGAAWRELGVAFSGELLHEVELGRVEPPLPGLPAASPEGYTIDAPLAAAALAESVARESWTGLFLAFDYGKSWEEIAHATPEGTARNYRQHVQGNDLLSHAGNQDLTCHVCWDWLKGALARNGFAEPKVESQEAFFVRHCGPLIESLVVPTSGPSREKLSLLQLLHPSHMGQKFQVLWALRRSFGR